MEKAGNQITFLTEDNEEVLFSVVEQTMLNGCNYLLVTEETEDGNDEEADALILKETSEPNAKEAVYEIVEDETELQALADVFAELLEDTEII